MKKAQVVGWLTASVSALVLCVLPGCEEGEMSVESSPQSSAPQATSLVDRYISQSQTAYGESRWVDAEAYARQAVGTAPSNWSAWIQLGFILNTTGCYRDAEIAFRKAAALHGRSMLVWENLADTLVKQGKYTEAEEAAHRAQSCVEDPVQFSNLAWALLRQDKVAEAVSAVQQSIAKDTNNTDCYAHLYLAECYRRLDKRTECKSEAARAEAILRTALTKGATDETHEALAHVLWLQGRFADAEQSARRSLAINKCYYLAWTVLARSLASQGKHAEAEEAGLEALRVNSLDHKEYVDLLAVIGVSAEYAKLRPRVSTLAQQSIARQRPDSENRGYVVGRVYLRMDDFQNVTRDVMERAQVQIAWIRGSRLSKVTTTTDEQGYFVLTDQSLDGHYLPYQIKVSTLTAPVPSIVPDPDPTQGLAGMLYIAFASSRESFLPIIDCGETIVTLKKDNKLAVERKLGPRRAILDPTKDKKYESLDGDYGFPGLQYYSRVGQGALREAASSALEDHRSLLRAESLLKAIPGETKGDDLVEKWLEVLKTHSGAEQAYDRMAFLLRTMKKPDRGVQILQQLIAQKPNDPRLRAYLVRSHLDNADVAAAIRTAEEKPQSFIYYRAYQALWANYQFDGAEQMLRKAIAAYSDGSLFSEDYEALTKRLERLPMEKKSSLLFVSYLKAIQEDSDCANWQDRPYDRFISRYPLAKNIDLNAK